MADSEAAQFLRRAGGGMLPSDPNYPELGMGKMFYADPYAKANGNMYGSTASSESGFYQQNGLAQPGVENIQQDANQDASAREGQKNTFLIGTAVTGGVILTPIVAGPGVTAVLANPATTTELGIVATQTTLEVTTGATIVGVGTIQAGKQVLNQLDNISPTVPLLPSPQSLGRVPNATGQITSEVLDDSTIFYRAFGGDSGPVGGFLAPTKPLSRAEAITGNALPPGNTAEYVSTLRVEGGVRVQRSTAASAFDQPGGNPQVELLDRSKITVINEEPLK